MATHVSTAAQAGFRAVSVDVECDLHQGLPSVSIVGLGSKAIEEAKERVRSAIQNTSLTFPRKRIVVNLAPADMPKDGSYFDLSIAVAILAADNQIPNLKNDYLRSSAFIGELSLDGSLRAVRGVIALVQAVQTSNKKRVFIPLGNVDQASLVNGIEIIPAEHLKDVLAIIGDPLHKMSGITKHKTKRPAPPKQYDHVDFKDIRGQAVAKRAMMIAAAGHHNILLNGPPGSGKTMMAKALTSIMPSLTASEIIDVTKLHSLSGDTISEVVTDRPFRAPHHTTSTVAMVGGGRLPLPGEISLAHNGVLFLDELPEYPRATLESLRQPLEDQLIHIARAHLKTTFPANFMLVATQNPCPCGFLDDPSHECTCSPSQISHYHKKLSGPLLDRIDIKVYVHKVNHRLLLKQSDSLSSADMKQQISNALQMQNQRFSDISKRNASMTNREIKKLANLLDKSTDLLNNSADKLMLSARAYIKTVKVARTIADTTCSDVILPEHIAEALQYRIKQSSG